MAEIKKIIIDAGHGGSDFGAVYSGRQEKDEVLRLALAVGNVLEQNGFHVEYTRVDDTYHTPPEKAVIANNSEADYFISLHRNAMPEPNTASGSMTLVYKKIGMPALMAETINCALQKIGFSDLGVTERPGVAVLRRTQMPAMLVEVGFIDSEADNQIFDMNFNRIVQAIAGGIMQAMKKEKSEPEYYQIQTGAYRNKGLAEQMMEQLQFEGFPSFLIEEEDYCKVRVGAFVNLDNAAQMEKSLREYGYNTFIIKR